MQVRPVAARGIFVTILLAMTLVAPPTAQSPADQPVFRSGVDLVSLAAVVRDARGKVVSTLQRDDFELLDGGHRRPILDLRTESAAPATVAILVDSSGSMRMGAAIDASRRISNALLESLNPTRDDAALFTFDTRLLVMQDFTRDMHKVRAQLEDLQPWGSTSLFDAVAGTAGIASKRTTNRRAVVVLTDGLDTASTYSPTEVSAIASSVDVPIYVFALMPPRSAEDVVSTARHSTLQDLANWTGGSVFVASDEVSLAAGINQLVEELRHQYVIAFAASGDGGWRSVQLKARKRGLTVRTRAWYLSGSGE